MLARRAALPLLFWLLPALALADAALVVRIGPSVPGREATVIVRDGDREIGRCHTDHGSCRIEGIDGGRFTVVARADDGTETAPRTVVVPPSGEVTLILSTP